MSHARILVFVGTAASIITLLPGAIAADGDLRFRSEGASTFIQVQGDPDDDWRIETSSDLINWNAVAPITTLLSGDEDAPRLSVDDRASSQGFYRALKTDGLYDITLLRTISLTFTQSNWQSLLASARISGSNVLASVLKLDNGATLVDVGVRYKGNTSYSGMGQGGAPTKKSVNIEMDHTDSDADLMGYETVNLNNAFGDETILREPLYFNVMRNYTVCPKGSFVKLIINGEYWGVYSFAQQENGDLIKEWFPSNDGDRWAAPNAGGRGGGGPGGGGGGGGGGGFSSPLSALSYLGAAETTYQANYELKTQKSTNAWQQLIHAVDVLNNTPTEQLREKVEEVLAVDRWLWFLAIENVFADDDSYFNKGADYGFYYEPESGRIHPIEHDGNEAFVAGDRSLSPVQGATSSNRPLLYRLLPIPELRQRYLAHMRTVLQEYFNPTVMTALIDQYSALTVGDIAADPKKRYTMTAYTNDLTALKTFVKNRHAFLTNHAELKPVAPTIVAAHGPASEPAATETPFITAEVRANAADGVHSVWLYHRGASYGRFTAVQMLDDGAHGDGGVGDAIYGAAATAYPAGTKVRFYVEARSANAANAAGFSPARAEQETFSYQVTTAQTASTPVVINELMASNSETLADPEGDFDDWIELRNVTSQDVDLTGRYLSDNPSSTPRKWAFPAGTIIAANGFLIVWVDEDGSASSPLHANFRLAASGEQVLLVDSDVNNNGLLDSVVFDAQQTDRSYGRLPADLAKFGIMHPTPGRQNLSP